MPIVPPAPVLFSITTCWPIVREICSPTTRAKKSNPPPGASGTMKRTGAAGYACCLATRDAAGRATAAAASRRNCRRGGFIVFLSAVLAIGFSNTGLRESIRLGARKGHHLAPLLGFLGDELAEVGGRACEHHAAQVGEPRFDLR